MKKIADLTIFNQSTRKSQVPITVPISCIQNVSSNCNTLQFMIKVSREMVRSIRWCGMFDSSSNHCLIACITKFKWMLEYIPTASAVKRREFGGRCMA
jgi:hypothetical protein